MNDIKISACIPTYNRTNYLKCAITSLLRQSQPVNEIVVVDDGSTDNTEQVINDFGLQDKIKYFKFKRNENLPRYLTMVTTFNFCIEKASSNFVSIIGDDDLVSYNWCEVIKRAIRVNNNMNIFYFSLSVIDDQNRVRRIWSQVHNEKIFFGADIAIRTNILFGVLGNFVFRKDFIDNIGKFSTEFGTFFDKEFYCRLAFLKVPIYFSNKNIYFYRMHKGQTSNMMLHGYRNTKDKVSKLFENSEYICRINNKYKGYLLKYDLGFKYFMSRNYLALFRRLFINNIFFRELSFLYIQGLYKGFIYKDMSIHKKNCATIAKYFVQINSKIIRLFLLLYFVKYWVYFINFKALFLSFLQRRKDENLRISL